jgi:N-acetylglutamate synthase-like GNAT family acetyltransferase
MSIEILKVTELNPRLKSELLVLLHGEGLVARWLPDSELFVRLDSNGNLEGGVCFKDFEEESLILFVAVTEDARHEGAGITLINHVLGYCTGRRDRVFVLTDRAQEFFRRFGFADITLDELPPAIAAADEVREIMTPGMTALVLQLPGRFSMM